MSDMTNEIFDLQGDALRDYSIKSKLLREYISDSNPTDNDPNIVINIRDTSEFLAMGQSWLCISGLSTGAGIDANLGFGTNANASNCGLEAGGACSLFHTVRLRVANVLVESNDVYSHINSFTKSLMNYCDDYARSIAVSNGFVLDTMPTTDDAPFVTTTVLSAVGGTASVPTAVGANPATLAFSKTVANPNHNSGYATRKALFGLTTTGRQRQTFYLPLRNILDFCEPNKVIRGCAIRLELVKRSIFEMVYGSSAESYFSIDKCSLWMPIIQPSLPILASLESQISKGISIPWSYNNWRTYASNGSKETNRRYQFNTQSDKPLFCFLACKFDKPSATLQQNFNNLQFDHCNATSCQLLVNGLRVPYSAYTPVWGAGSTQDTSRVYSALMEYNSKYLADSETGSLINIANHRSLYPYYFFDLGSLDDLPSNGGYQLSVEITLASPAPTENMVMYLTVVSESRWNLVGGEQGLQVVQA